MRAIGPMTHAPFISHIAGSVALRRAVIAVFAGVGALLVGFLADSILRLGYSLTAPYALSTITQFLLTVTTVVLAARRRVVTALQLFVAGVFLTLLLEPHIVDGEALALSLLLMPGGIAGLLVTAGLVFEPRVVVVGIVLGVANTVLTYSLNQGAAGVAGLPLVTVMPLLSITIIAAGVSTLFWDRLAAKLIGQAEEEAVTARSLADEREVLVRESSHRVKNNLQVIASMLDLQIAEVADESICGVLADARNRVGAMVVVHQSLHEAGRLGRVDIAVFLEELVDQLVEGLAADQESFHHEVEAEHVEVEPKTLVPLGLVVNELVTNALQHGLRHAGKSQPRLRVSLRKRAGQDSYELEVSDTGSGLPEGFSIERRDSLGLSLVMSLVCDQLGGQFSITSNGGTRALAVFDGSLFSDKPPSSET
jgi:two-component sensor histidine kinase